MNRDEVVPPHRSERAIIFCLGAVQFVNVLDFMIVMPLGPDFAKDLGIPLSHLGSIGGSYTGAASIAGVVGALFLDRFDRRNALVVAMVGLVLGTFAGAFATGLRTLMLARILAGSFGGPATSLSYSIIADVIPAERRGKAMGAVMGALSVASVLGVPAGLELSRRGSWRLPLVAVAVLGAAIAAFAALALPPMSGHLAEARKRSSITELRGLVRADVGLALTTTFSVMASSFIIVPNIAAYVLQTLHYPRARLGLLYLVGGAVSFIAMRVVGRMVDRYGGAPVGSLGTLLLVVVVYLGFARFPPVLPVMGIFVCFMLAMSFRNVAYNTLVSRVPAPHERARFASMQSAVQHFAASVGAFASTQMLTVLPDGSLGGMAAVATASIAIAVTVIPELWIVESRVVKRAAS